MTPDAIQSGHPTVTARLTTTPLGVRLLGIEVKADVYDRNGFRFLKTPACVDKYVLDTEAQRLKLLTRFGRGRRTAACIRTGCDEDVPVEDAIVCVSRLRDPKQRFFCELFWPHISGDAFDYIRRDHNIASAQAIGLLKASVSDGTGSQRALVRHALAVAYHNLAIDSEMQVKDGKGNWSDSHWSTALAYWSDVLNDQHFWQYLAERAETFEDPRLRLQDLQELRNDLPKAILAFNALFAQIHARQGTSEISQKHIELIKRCGLSPDAKKRALESSVRLLVKACLWPLIHKMRNPCEQQSEGKQEDICPKCGAHLYAVKKNRRLTGETVCIKCDAVYQTCPFCKTTLRTAKSKQCPKCHRSWHLLVGATELRQETEEDGLLSRIRFATLYDPILEEAMRIPKTLGQILGLDGDLVESSQFDEFCALMQRKLDTKLDYQTDDRARTLLYSMLVTKKLLTLPLSEGLRMKLGQELKNNVGYLYDRKIAAIGIDPTLCYFLSGEPADPDASIVWDMHKDTQVRGKSVMWTKMKMLVPRSKLAEQAHSGKVKSGEVIRRRQDDQAKKIDAQIEQIKRWCVDRTRPISERLLQEQAKLKNAMQAALEDFNAKVTDQEKADKAHIQAVQDKLNEKVAAEKSRFSKEHKALQQQVASKIRAAELVYGNACRKLGGFGGWLRRSFIPAVLAAGLMAGITVLALAIGILDDDLISYYVAKIQRAVPKLASSPVPLTATTALPALSGLFTFVIASCLAEWIRRARLFRARIAFWNAKDRHQKEADGFSQKARHGIQLLQKSAEASLRGHRRRLEANNSKRKRIESGYQKQIKALQQKVVPQLKRIQAEADKKVRTLEKQLESRAKVQPESAKKSYPAYEQAKKQGYKDGVSPPESEIDRLLKEQYEKFERSLRPQDKARLAYLARTMSNKAFSDLVFNLMTMPLAERRRMLERLVPPGLIDTFGAYY